MTMLQKILNRYGLRHADVRREAGPHGASATAGMDAIDHPAIQAMSEREIADLPLPSPYDQRAMRKDCCA